MVTDIANYSNVAAFGYMQSQSVAQNLQYDLQTCHKFIHTSMKYSDQIEYINNADSSNLIIILSESVLILNELLKERHYLEILMTNLKYI